MRRFVPAQGEPLLFAVFISLFACAPSASSLQSDGPGSTKQRDTNSQPAPRKTVSHTPAIFLFL